MNDEQRNDGQVPDERAFTGHPDHPPEQSDQPADGNQELLSDGDDANGGNEDQEGDSRVPGDSPSTLPGYG